ncbi:hypothetical protein DXG03_004046 [Asterophora parasitica]|uniref:Uncharacterized protein n=1 Tax=Asterophora parasitica TaxID=117018 RepID=A0A9P7GBD4_9AGAR|nr:hypothetical protein DXG03_004046 [Asterophora parasitica]
MAGVPPSSDGPSRPYTSSGRPTTAAGHGTSYAGHNPQYTYGPDYDFEEEEEESEDEDVFAFLPPSTAEQQQQKQQEQQFQHIYPHNHPTDPPSDPVFANSPQSPHVAYPSPTFDPYARYPADSLSGMGPSTPHFQYFQGQPQTPPSTDSNNHNASDDPYRLRRLNVPPETPISNVPMSAESREVRVSLTAGSQATTGSEKEVDMEAGTSRRRSQRKRQGSSVTDSLSLGRSAVEEDDETTREGSIK